MAVVSPILVKEPMRKEQPAEGGLGRGDNVWTEPVFVDWFIEVFGRGPSCRDSFAELVAASRRRSEWGRRGGLAGTGLQRPRRVVTRASATTLLRRAGTAVRESFGTAVVFRPLKSFG